MYMYLAVKERRGGHIIFNFKGQGSSNFGSMGTPRKRPPNQAVQIRTDRLREGAGASVPVSIN
jgi:hypothetical protein